MEEYTTGKGIWDGWYWRFVGLTVLGVSVLELIAQYAVKYPLIQSLTLGVLIVSYLVIPRVKERRLANAIVGVIATVIIGVLLQVFFEKEAFAAANFKGTLELDAISLALGLVMAYLYLRITMWSEKRRAQLDAKKRQEAAPARPPVRRHHSQKKRKKGNRR